MMRQTTGWVSTALAGGVVFLLHPVKILATLFRARPQLMNGYDVGNFRYGLCRLAFGVLAIADFSVEAFGQAVYIKADNTNALNVADSYVANSGVPGPADTLQFDNTLTAARTAPLGGSLSVYGITVPANYAQRFTFGSSSGAALTIGAGGLNKSNTTVAIYLSCCVALGTNQTWNIAGNSLVLNGPSPMLTDNSRSLLVTGAGTLDLRPPGAITLGSNVTVNCTQVNVNANAADVTFGGTNTFKTLLLVAGIAEGSTFPADTNAATTSHFGNASSGAITFGANSANAATLIYNGSTAATPKAFTYDVRSTGTATIKVGRPGQTLTLTASPVLSNGGSQTTDKNWNFGGAGNLTLNGALSNASGSSYRIGLNKSDAGTLTLRGTNTYSGDTLINGGTLAVSGSGSLSNTASIVLAGGTTFDVSGLSSGAFSLSPGQTMGNNTAATSALKGNINASQGAIAVSVNGTAPAFTIGSGVFTVSTSTVFQIDSGIATPGTYPLITKATGGSVTGTLPAITLYRATGYLQINAGELDLVVQSSDVGNYYVSTTGSDVTGDGTLENPWQTVAMARDALRNVGAQGGDVPVYLRGGTYHLTNTLMFTTADSGKNGHYIVYKSYPGESATISGGKQVTGWTQVPGKPYWVASVPTSDGFADYFRQLYVNGIRAERARSDWINGLQYVWTNGATFNFSTANSGLTSVWGIAFATNSGLKTYSNVSDLRLLHVKHFKVDEFPILNVITNSGKICVQLQQPYCQTRYDYAPGYFDATSPWMIVNAFEEMDEPGEWYLNRATQQVYYYPNSFEDMTTAVVYAPVVDPLVSVGGDSPVNKVQNLRFQGLTFEHGNWFRPRDNFIGGGEAEGILGVSGSGGCYSNTEVPGVIRMTNTVGIQFIGNTIQHQGACGIQANSGARDTLIQGNLFSDLTGAAVLNYHQYGSGEIPTNTIVADNVVRNIGMDFMGGTCLDNLGGYGFQAVRNDLADCQYDGIHQHNGISSLATNPGHGASMIASNRMALAFVGARYDVQDGGYIYTSGVWPNTVIVGNDICDMNQPTAIWTFGLYQDYDSYGLTWSSNVMRDFFPGIKGGNWQGWDSNDWPNLHAYDTYTDATIYYIGRFGLQTFHNYVQITNGVWPAEAQAIIQAAGVGPGYTNLLRRIYSGDNLARGKFTWSSSSNATSQAGADWNYGTVWSTASNDTNGWWAVDLGAPYVIQRLEFVPRTDLDDPDARCSFQVQASNNTNFTGCTVLGEQNSVPFAYRTTGLRNSWIKYVNNPSAFRYLRVRKASGWKLSVSEFQAYGYPPSPSTYTWTKTAGGAQSWVTAGNWQNGFAPDPISGDTLDFSTVDIAANTTLSLGADRTGTTWLFGDTSGVQNWIVAGGSQIILEGAMPTIHVAQNSVTFSNGVSGSAGVTKTGAGTLTLAGATTYSGDTVIDQGTLTLGTSFAPASGSLTFGASAGSTNTGTLNLSGGSGTFDALTVWNNSTLSNVITIASGKTLAINGNVTVGANNGASTTTKLTVTGSGSWNVVNASGGLFQVGMASAGSSADSNILDMSGLGTFSMNLGTGTNLVGGTGGAMAGSGNTLILANAVSSITAGALLIGNTCLATSTHYLKLGSGTNTLNIDAISVGAHGAGGRSSGRLQFNTGSGTVKIRGANGSSAAALNVVDTSNGTGTTYDSRFDVTGHAADLLFSTVNMMAVSAPSGAHKASFSFDCGTLTATTFLVGARTGGTSANTQSATVNIGSSGNYPNTANLGVVAMAQVSGVTTGGISGTLNIAGSNTIAAISSLCLASNSAVGATATGTFSLAGGTATLVGDITVGGTVGRVYSTLALNGGTLDMNGHNIGSATTSLSTFTFSGGVLQDVGTVYGTLTLGNSGAREFNQNSTGTISGNIVSSAGAGLLKTGGGILEITSAGNTYSGGTTVRKGTLRLSGLGRAGTGDVIVEGGVLELATGTAIADTATLDVRAGAQIRLSGVNETVNRLLRDGRLMPPGTWGATGSGARYVDNMHFVGNGILTVLSGTRGGTILQVL